jgi:hypothetical protein
MRWPLSRDMRDDFFPLAQRLKYHINRGRLANHCVVFNCGLLSETPRVKWKEVRNQYDRSLGVGVEWSPKALAVFQFALIS